jgi:UDP:flavonoid glycosyltransferase YjiC (YdhE family)
VIDTQPLVSSRPCDHIVPAIGEPGHRGRRPRALFLSIPAYGHIRGLVLQARALAQRGWDVRLASLDEARSFVDPRVPFEGLGSYPSDVPGTAELNSRATAEPDFQKGMLPLLDWLLTGWGSLFDGALHLCRRWTPDLIVADILTTSGIDIADLLGVPVVLNNPSLLPIVSEAILPPATTVPLMFRGRSRSKLSYLDRATYHPLRLLGLAGARRLLRQFFDPLRAVRGLPPADALTRAAGRRVLVNTAFPLEYDRPLPADIHLVGPMLDDDEPSLDPDLAAWLSAGAPVTYISLGTVAVPGADLVTPLARGLADAGTRTLWVLRGEAASMARKLAPDLRIEPWISSPLAVLRHPNTRAFVSHCGVNSVHEAVVCGVPIVGIPLFFDQQDMALRAFDAGVALVLPKKALKAEAVRAAVRRVIDEPAFRRPMPRLQAALLAAGGVKRAADLIEDAARIHWQGSRPNFIDAGAK